MLSRAIARRGLCNSARCLTEDTGSGKAPLARVVYMSQLPYDVTKEQLNQVFERYGPIEEIHLPMTKGREHVKGYGRMVFADEKNARRAAVQMQCYVINNRPIRLTLGPDLKEKQKTKYDVVMLKNLSYEAKEDELMKVLRPYQALRVGLPRSPIKNECLGYGYVRFASPEAAERAIEALNRQTVCGRKIRMHLAEPKEHHYRFIV